MVKQCIMIGLWLRNQSTVAWQLIEWKGGPSWKFAPLSVRGWGWG